MVLFGPAVLISHPGARPRRPELPAAAAAIETLVPLLGTIQGPGTLEGGDVLKIGDTVYVGRSTRTNPEGVRQLRALLRPLGRRVIAVPVTKTLHLKSAVTALPDGTVIGYPPLLEPAARALFPSFLEVPEEGGSHVVLLGGAKLLLAASGPRTAELLTDFGYDPVLVDISEFEKLEGCVTCLSVRVRSELP